MIKDLKPLLGKLAIFAKNRFGFEHPPKLFLKQDKENGGCALGKTAHYDPAEKAVTIFVSNRHPKDILRSFTHELVHHCQNLRGDLSPEKMKAMSKNYAQENDHMRKMEQEAYLEGNMCFRDWEDSLENKLQYKITIAIAEQKFLKENKQMTVKINKKFLKGLITKLLEEKESEEIVSEESTCAKDCDCEKCKEARGKAEESLEEGEVPAGLKKYQDEQAAKAGKTSSEASAPVDADDEDSPAEDGEKPDIGDIDKDGNKKESAKGAAKDKERQEESKIQTPEQEKALYESRFTKKNTRLYEKLLKEWTK